MKRIVSVVFVLCLLFLSSTSFANCPVGEEREDGEKWYRDISTGCFSYLMEMRRDDPKVVLLDVRSKEEFDEERLSGAILLDYYAEDFYEKVQALDPTNIYLIYCRTANRSGRTLGLMRYLGFEEAYNMEYGLVKWSEEGRSTIKNSSAPTPPDDEDRGDGGVVLVDDDTFQGEVYGIDGYVLVKFYMPKCPPCKKLAPVYESLAQEYSSSLKFAEYDVTKQMKVFKDLGLKYTPTVLLFKDGKVLEKLVGQTTKDPYIKLLQDYDIIN
ncbi:MAG: thioredoxin fold domain-containing protein [Deltaproteobacteria bacterium]|jgi:thiol-disulfide isomerase/thioredoxin|nr:thioredoxin fold domain-containing protein [Deltaproteobacteria bacterium]